MRGDYIDFDNSHPGKSCDEAHDGVSHLHWVVRNRRKKQVRMAIGGGLALVALGIVLGAVTGVEPVAWALVIPGLLVLAIGGRPVRDRYGSRGGRNG